MKCDNMTIDEKEYGDKVLEAYKMAYRVIGSLVELNDPDFKDMENNENNEKMKWILFENLLNKN